MVAKRNRRRRSSGTRCRFCREDEDTVDYKDVDQLKNLTTREARMFSRKRSGNCARHQRMFKKAVKHARFLALLPYQ
jgi:small subunit ribosomal protein S18